MPSNAINFYMIQNYVILVNIYVIYDRSHFFNLREKVNVKISQD